MDSQKIPNIQEGTISGITRRDVLKTAAIGTGALLLLPMLSRNVEAADNWVVAGPSSQFVLDQTQHVLLPNSMVIWVTRHTKSWTAISAKCTHKGCEVTWEEPNKQFSCPCHGAAFNADGSNIHGTTRHPEEKLASLATLPVREKHGNVEVNLITPAA